MLLQECKLFLPRRFAIAHYQFVNFVRGNYTRAMTVRVAAIAVLAVGLLAGEASGELVDAVAAVVGNRTVFHSQLEHPPMASAALGLPKMLHDESTDAPVEILINRALLLTEASRLGMDRSAPARELPLVDTGCHPMELIEAYHRENVILARLLLEKFIPFVRVTYTDLEDFTAANGVDWEALSPMVLDEALRAAEEVIEGQKLEQRLREWLEEEREETRIYVSAR